MKILEIFCQDRHILVKEYISIFVLDFVTDMNKQFLHALFPSIYYCIFQRRIRDNKIILFYLKLSLSIKDSR